MWGYPYWPATRFLGSPFSHGGYSFFSQRVFLYLTELTGLTEPFCARLEHTEGLRHTEVTEAFQLTLAVTLCVIGWLNVSVALCVFCSSVFFCEKKKTLESRGGDFSLTELTDITELFHQRFEPMREWPLPHPLPRREGRDMWGYPYWPADTRCE